MSFENTATTSSRDEINKKVQDVIASILRYDRACRDPGTNTTIFYEDLSAVLFSVIEICDNSDIKIIFDAVPTELQNEMSDLILARKLVVSNLIKRNGFEGLPDFLRNRLGEFISKNRDQFSDLPQSADSTAQVLAASMSAVLSTSGTGPATASTSAASADITPRTAR